MPRALAFVVAIGLLFHESAHAFEPPTTPALVPVEAASGFAGAVIAIPATRFLSLVYGSVGMGAVLGTGWDLIGTLVLPPLAAAGAVWAIADTDPLRRPSFRNALMASSVGWLVFLAGAAIVDGDLLGVLFTMPRESLRSFGIYPRIALGAAVAAIAATVVVNLTLERRYEPRRTEDPLEEEEDPFAMARPLMRPAEPLPGNVTTLLAGRF